MKTRWKILTAVILVAVALGLGWQGSHSSFDVAWEGPRVQNDWAIARVQRINSDDTYVWRCHPLKIFGLTLPLMAEGPEILYGHPSSHPTDSLGVWLEKTNPDETAYYSVSLLKPEALTVEAQTSTGDRFPLEFDLSDRRHFMARVPPGWPPSCRWIDIVLRDPAGHRARWRLVHLPPARRAFAPPAAPSNVWHGLGGTLTLQAWPGTNGFRGGTSLRARLTAAPAADSYLEIVREQSPLPEWGTSRQATSVETSIPLHFPTASYDIFNLQSPWTRGVGWLRYACRVRRVDVLSETVTLRGLRLRRVPLPGEPGVSVAVWDAPPQRARTASGISVEMTAVPVSERNLTIPNASLAVRVTPDTQRGPVRLAASPVCRRSGKPVQIVLSIPGGIEQDIGSSGTLLLYPLRRHGETALSSVTVIVEQRAAMAEADATFTAPVSATPPPGVRP